MFDVFDLTRLEIDLAIVPSGNEPTIVHTRNEHANIFTTVISYTVCTFYKYELYWYLLSTATGSLHTTSPFSVMLFSLA